MLACLVALAATGCKRSKNASGPGEPLTAPSPAKAPRAEADDGFKVTAESFADLRVLRYRVSGFEALSLQQKKLLYFLHEAALSGRDIAYDQKYVHNLAVRRTLEAILEGYPGDRTTPAFKALVTYAKRVWFSNGIHHHYSSKKFVPEGLSAEAWEKLVRALDAKRLPLAAGETVDALIRKLTPVIFDPKLDAKGVNKDSGADPVADSANHFYAGLTKGEVESYTKRLLQVGDPTPISVGLNSQLRKAEGGAIEERVWRVDGMYGAALARCVSWLEKALDVAETPAQRSALERLITYYKTGSLEDWDRYSVAWVEDTTSSIDLIHGFIETYGDAMDLRGSYEAIVQLEDVEATKRIKTLSANAQWFEDNSPIADAYKKENVVGVSARVIQAVVASGDAAPSMPIGVNLPNANWIRAQHGSKSVTIGNVMAAYEASGRDNGVLEAFAATPLELSRGKEYGALAQALMVDLHEVIGHASGRLAPGVADVGDTLRQYGGTLEEGRADLVALYYILDPKLVELKVMPNLEVGRAAYDAYIHNALLIQLARVPLGESLEEAHMRNRQLIARWILEQGASDNVIEKIVRDDQVYYVVRDYVKMRKLVGRLLSEVQRIKSEGDFESARELVETHGVRVDPELHAQVRERYERLGVAPYAGFIQPELTPVLKGEEIVDVTIRYPEDFMAQHLGYASKYSFLPTYN
jgi:dipeptidyl-peptidase-3